MVTLTHTDLNIHFTLHSYISSPSLEIFKPSTLEGRVISLRMMDA